MSLPDLLDCLHYRPETGRLVWRGHRDWRRLGTHADHGLSRGYRIVTATGSRTQLAHRLVWMLVHGDVPHIIDHINGDKTDNRICNLRSVNARVNSENRRIACASSTSGLLGAIKHRDAFVSAIRVRNRRIHLGRFKTAQEAHAAYLIAKRELHEGCTI